MMGPPAYFSADEALDNIVIEQYSTISTSSFFFLLQAKVFSFLLFVAQSLFSPPKSYFFTLSELQIA